MHLHNTNKIKFKIVFFSTLCIAVVGILSTAYLYTYLDGIILEKAENIDTLYLDNIQNQLDTQFQELHNLGILCASSYEVSNAMRHNSLYTPTAKKDVFSAQALMNDYLHSSTVSRYVNKMFIFNDKNLTVQALAKENGTLNDLPNLLSSDFYQNYNYGDIPFQTIMPSVTGQHRQCLAALFPISNYISPVTKGYLYMEISPALITDVLNPYCTLNPIFVAADSGGVILPPGMEDITADYPDPGVLLSQDTLFLDGREYRMDIRRLNKAGLSVINCRDLSAIAIDNRRKTYALAIVILSVLLTALGITAIISNYITRPIQRLIARIKRISDNDFSTDPDFETSSTEIGEVFRVVNEMSSSINRLIEENVAKTEEKKNIEIDLLQSQINPHFLYNTLDSIHWMAVIQKNTGISDITRCLSNLLKNMSKGFAQKIPLEEELRLLDDYITIQSIRYLETFELVNRIPHELYRFHIIKLTLQPLVENAIFHGIEPSGVYGTITLDAWTEDEYLLLTVTDTGIGMSPEELSHVLDISPEKTKHSMNGIGVGNVNKRLRLVYGPPCGLTFESEQGKGTRITVRIKKEETVL